MFVVFKNMLEELCRHRELPDMEFFVNRRDTPLLTKNDTEHYFHIWGDDHPLVSHLCERYVPIMSMSTTDKPADILIPTPDDWARIQSSENKWFLRIWVEISKQILIFHGMKRKKLLCFVVLQLVWNNNRNKNMRMKVAEMNNQSSLLDTGITKWNTRIRKLKDEPYLQTIQPPFETTNKLSLEEQAKYKYIINIDGHVSAFRLSMELGSGSVVLLVESEWKMWITEMLEPYKHYVPVRSDLSDLIDQITWCKSNDAKCKEIAENARQFYRTQLSKDGVFDYLQHLFVQLKSHTGHYEYTEHLATL